MIQNAQLGEHRGLIPIEMLVGHLTGLKLDNAHPGGLDLSTRSRHAKYHPIHVQRISKANYELLDDPILAEDL